jgi:hypothetical protein
MRVRESKKAYSKGGHAAERLVVEAVALEERDACDRCDLYRRIVTMDRQQEQQVRRKGGKSGAKIEERRSSMK